MIVNVTQEHINKAKEFRDKSGLGEYVAGLYCENCPISLALKEITGKATAVFYNDGFLPEEARAFIYDFDSFGHVEPFSFEIVDPGSILGATGAGSRVKP